MSAKGNGGNYHYYACSGRQKLGRKACDADRLPRDKLEAAVLAQLTDLYRDGALIHQAIEHAAANEGADRAALAEQRAGLAMEISRSERAIERYHDAFEAGDLDPERYDARVSALDARIEALSEQDHTLAHELAAAAPTTADTAQLTAVADHLDQTIAGGDPDQSKALLRLLIAELRVNGRKEILPTYRVPDPSVCAQRTSVELAGLEPATSWVRSGRHIA